MLRLVSVQRLVIRVQDTWRAVVTRLGTELWSLVSRRGFIENSPDVSVHPVHRREPMDVAPTAGDIRPAFRIGAERHLLLQSVRDAYEGVPLIKRQDEADAGRQGHLGIVHRYPVTSLRVGPRETRPTGMFKSLLSRSPNSKGLAS